MSTDIRSSEWDSVIADKRIVAADFWAPWCPYCIRLKPVFDSVAKEYTENIKFVKVNVGEESDLASRYGIQGIPVIKFFCESKEVGEIVGYLPQDILKKEIENISRNAPNCLANTSLRK
ncbi:MAG: thioredoxin family protein [Thermoproteota archaeon]|nr:thioredoxin family protein [Thermoproteota archaeon]